MSQSKLKLPWRIFTLIISILLFLHFLKDITQDLLGITTALDVMGNIEEDTSRLPKLLVPVYWSMWVIATISQPIVVYLSYKNWKNKVFNKHDLAILFLVLFFALMVLWAYWLSL